jgi:2-oxoglutarate dehydrogenase E2 component (dihydrolipoamide succinyltransferase)
VKNIAKEEGISISELESITGTGNEGRVTKNDHPRLYRQPEAPVCPQLQPQRHN